MVDIPWQIIAKIIDKEIIGHSDDNDATVDVG